MSDLHRIQVGLALAQILSPAAAARSAAYRQEAAQVYREGGAAFAQLWHRAQRWVHHPGRVLPPPAVWDFLPSLARARANRTPADFDDEQRVQLRAFWDWYLPVESALLGLIAVIRELHALEELELLSDVYTKAHAIHVTYQLWMRDGALPWLPEGRSGYRGTIVERLGHALIECDRGPNWGK